MGASRVYAGNNVSIFMSKQQFYVHVNSLRCGMIA